MQNATAGNRAELSVGDGLDAYYVEHVSVKVVDHKRQKAGIDHLKRHLGSKPFRVIDIKESRAYALARRAEGVIDSTVRRELNILVASANHCAKWKHLPAAELPIIELPEVAESEDVKWFSKEQIATMLRARPFGHFGCFLRLAYFGAARRNSVERLLKTQVNRENNFINLQRPGERKTKKRKPTIPIYPEMRAAIDWLFDHSGTPYLFGRERDFYKPFEQLMEELHLTGHPHMLRHSRATHMLMDGENPYRVASLLGDNLQTVLRVYAHVTVDFVAQNKSSVEGAAMIDVKAKPRYGQYGYEKEDTPQEV